MKLRKILIVGVTYAFALTVLIATTKVGKTQSSEPIHDLSAHETEISKVTIPTTENTIEYKMTKEIKTGGYFLPTTEEITTEIYTEEPSEIEEQVTTEEVATEAVTEDTSLPEPLIEEESEPVEEESEDPAAAYSFDDLMWMGVIYWGDWKWTYYSESVLSGEGLNIPGRYTDKSGFVCDGNGYICLASSDLSYGTVVSTPFGRMGCVYDTGCPSGTLDVYVQ